MKWMKVGGSPDGGASSASRPPAGGSGGQPSRPPPTAGGLGVRTPVSPWRAPSLPVLTVQSHSPPKHVGQLMATPRV